MTADRKTADSLYGRMIGANDVNKGIPTWIHARDDDELVRGARFVVFADSAPPAPTLTGPSADTAYFTKVPVVLQWMGLDKHDSLATDFAVLVNPPGAATPEDTVQTFRSAAQYTLQGSTVAFTYSPQLAGVYSWRIVARDARRSVSSSAARQFSHPGN